MENEGFFGDSGTKQVVGEACQWQVTLLEEGRGQTMHHAPTHEIQRRTGDWRLSTRREVFSNEVST